MKWNSIYYVLLFPWCCVLMGGCSDGGNPSGPVNIEGNLVKAWDNFEAGTFQSASEGFQKVLDIDPDNHQALLGLGWSQAFLGQYRTAEKNLKKAALSDSTAIDAQMGLAIVYRDLPDYDLALSCCDQVLRADVYYIFSPKESINFLDAHLIRAHVYFRKGPSYYRQSEGTIDYLSEHLGLTPLPSREELGNEEYECVLLERLQELTELID